MSDEVIVSRNVPIPAGRQLANNSLSVTLASDQPPIPIISAADIPSETKTSMFGFPVVESRQFLLQELATYGIDETIWRGIGDVTYDSLRSCVQLLPSNLTSLLSTHQSAFSYKYQPGKEICVSQAIQASIGPIAANLIQQWGEFTKRDGYGWRVLTQAGTSVNTGSQSIIPWHNYLCFFRRTSALPTGYTSTTVTSDPTGISTSANAPIILGSGNPNTLHRPSYLVGSGTVTDYLEAGAWEDITFTTLRTVANDNQVFNKDKLTGRTGDGPIPIDAGSRGKSAKEISYISLSFEITNVTGLTGSSITLPTLGSDNAFGTTTVKPLAGGWIRAGMSIRVASGGTTTYNGFVTSVSGNSISISPAISGTLSGSLFVNESTNLCMFLIQRSWYGGAGGKGLVYIPDSNTPFNGTTRWTSAHEVRIGDTLPVPSMSNPDMPITYQIGRYAGSTASINNNAFLRRFGVSVWINGGDPRPVKIESYGSGSPRTANTNNYVPVLAIAVKPFVYNKEVTNNERPQKSRVYPYKLYASSGGQVSEIYLCKLSSDNYTALNIGNLTWATAKTDSEQLKVVATNSTFNATTIAFNAGYPTGIGGKQIGPFYCGTNEGTEIDLTDIFDPQRELLGRAEATATGVTGDILLVIARSLGGTSSNVAASLVYGVQ